MTTIIPVDAEIPVDMCRICLESDSIKNLISPCLCRGTSNYVHQRCIDTWREVTLNPNARHTCQQCNSRFTLKRQHKLFHTKLFEICDHRSLYILQYSSVTFVFLGYNLMFHFELVLDFCFAIITVVGVEFLYCIYLWIFYVKQKCVAFITVFSYLMFTNLIYFFTSFDYPITHIMFFILTNIIHIGIINVMYSTVKDIRINAENVLIPCINRIN